MKAIFLIAFVVIVFFGGRYTGIWKMSDAPPAPNFPVEIGVVNLPSSNLVQSTLPQEWMLRALGRWPEAKFHQIGDKDGACLAHAQEGPTIAYKDSWRAHLTAFRMVQFIQPAALQPGLPVGPVALRSTPELEKDCGSAYDLIVFPFGVSKRATFF